MFVSKKAEDIKKTLSLLLMFLIISINGFVLLNFEIKYSVNYDLIRFKDILMDKQIYSGYASFWNGDVMTELSNGKIESYTFEFIKEKQGKELINNVFNWLQKKEHLTTKPEGKIYLILNKEETDNVVFDDNVETYVGENKQLYLFENYQDMMNKILN